jgi:prepilin-type N-terminal cleavage/methylation domain-containing protein
MKRPTASLIRGFTFIEVMMSSALVGVVVMFMASFLSLSALLFAKNTSTNLTHQSIRASLDKMVQDVTAANSTVRLITPAGAAVTTGAAAGARFDLLIGTPYVVIHPGGTGITATATSITIQRSTAAGLAPPIPIAGNVLLVDGAPAVRLKVASVATGSTTSGVQTLTLSLSSAAGVAISWDPTRVKSARLVRPVAYVVVPNAGANELRYFSAAEAITDFSSIPASQYALVIKNVGIAAGDAAPFSFVTAQGRSFLNIIFRVRSDRFDNRLSTKEKNEASAIQRIEFQINPRNV